MGKLPDEEAACNIIQRHRKYDRLNFVNKSIKTKLYEINGFVLSIGLLIKYNLKTNTITVGHGLRYKGHEIHPTTNQKRRCTNQHALDILAFEREYTRNKKKIQFTSTPGKHTEFYEHIVYNPHNGNVFVTSGFRGRQEHKIPIIDIG